MMAMAERGLLEHADPAELASALATQLGAIIDQAIRARGRAVLALAGGRTPMPAYRALAAQSRDWSRVIVIGTDERWVDAGHPARNDDEIAEAMQAATGLQLRALVPMRAELPPRTRQAEASLADLDGPFDAVLLGMGLDAHTASLFPGGEGSAAALDPNATGSAFVVTPTPLPAEAPYPRISLGRRRLLNARAHLLAITGRGKREVLQAARGGDPALQPIAAFLAEPLNLTIHWSP